MKNDVVYILAKGDNLEAFGNLKSLVSKIGAQPKYSSIWRALDKHGKAQYGDVVIRRAYVVRAPYKKANSLPTKAV